MEYFAEPHDNEPPELTSGMSVDLRAVFLGGIFVILLLASLRYASEIFMPLVLAFVLKLVLTPVWRVMNRLHLPRTVSAAAVIGLMLLVFAAFFSVLSEPAVSWANKLPSGLPKLKHHLGYVSESLEDAQKMMKQAEGLTAVTPPAQPVAVVQGPRLSDRIFTGTRAFLGGVFTTLLILFFLLISGDTFLRRLVEVLPRFKDKRQAVDISQQIEQDVALYLFTITLMNLGVGFASGLIMHFTGVGDPLLWGTLAFLLNYIPILGPLICGIVFVLAGLLTHSELWMALLPAGLYFVARFTEGTLITPLLLAKRFTMNPVLVVFSLIFWYWMWGIPGAILAVPMLAISKIICDRIEPLKPIGHFLAG